MPKRGKKPPQSEQRIAESLDELVEVVVASGVMGDERIDDPAQHARVAAILEQFDPDFRDDLVRRFATEDSLNALKIRRFCASHQLTDAEQRVVQSLCRGLSLKEHADAYCISPNTARTQLQRVREKVGVSRQADIVSKALS